jgi:hypothetical protein
MAQWLGQFSGHTHATAVADAEALLRHAVKRLRLAKPLDYGKAAKAVRGLAKRVLRARVRFSKARAVHLARTGREESIELHEKELTALRESEERLAEGGVAAILAEFGAPIQSGAPTT